VDFIVAAEEDLHKLRDQDLLVALEAEELVG
jgi:hypothetical protein